MNGCELKSINMKYAFILIVLLGIKFTEVDGQNYTYMGTYDSQGVPDYLTTSDLLSTSFLSMVNASLPESYPVPNYNPQYISSGVATNIDVEETTDVWVTFVAEGAGFKNSLGFYTYPTGNPPPTIDISNLNIIFPNVSAIGSGGD